MEYDIRQPRKDAASYHQRAHDGLFFVQAAHYWAADVGAVDMALRTYANELGFAPSGGLEYRTLPGDLIDPALEGEAVPVLLLRTAPALLAGEGIHTFPELYRALRLLGQQARFSEEATRRLCAAAGTFLARLPSDT